MRLVPALAVVIVLAAVAVPVVAETETALCLRVQAAPEVDLTDAAAVEEGIVFGDIVVTEVVPCEGATAPMASATPVSDVGIGAWDVRPLEIDPMTDDPRALVYLTAESGTSRFGIPITLSIGCTDESTRLTVSWIDWLGRDDLIKVDTRIGDGPVTTDHWINTTETETGYGGSDVAFIKSLFGETQLVLRTTTVDGTITAVFDITGIENAVASVREACGW